jgi:hypothetical protein
LSSGRKSWHQSKGVRHWFSGSCPHCNVMTVRNCRKSLWCTNSGRHRPFPIIFTKDETGLGIASKCKYENHVTKESDVVAVRYLPYFQCSLSFAPKGKISTKVLWYWEVLHSTVITLAKSIFVHTVTRCNKDEANLRWRVQVCSPL